MKQWYHSKTLWINTLAGMAIIIQAVAGQAWLNAELQAAIIVIANIILRVVTNQGLGK